MADYTVKRIEDMEAVYGGAFIKARAELGVTSFGMQVMDFPAGLDQYPEHDHAETGQEEVYLLLSGNAKMVVEGEEIDLDPSLIVRVGPGARRTIKTAESPARILALGGIPGKPFDITKMTELGEPDPLAQ